MLHSLSSMNIKLTRRSLESHKNI